MSKRIHPLSSTWKNKNISDDKKNDSHSNLTKGSARSRRGAEVVEEGAKASQTIMWLLYLCIKPETSET